MEEQNKNVNVSDNSHSQRKSEPKLERTPEQDDSPQIDHDSPDNSLLYDEEVKRFYFEEYQEYLHKAQVNARQDIEAKYEGKIYLGHWRLRQRAQEVDRAEKQRLIDQENERVRIQMEQSYFGSSLQELKRKWQEEDAQRREAEILNEKLKKEKLKKGRKM